MVLLDKIQNEILKGPQISIITLVQDLVAYAIGLRASDIHIDPEENKIRLRLRVDGFLIESFNFPKNIHGEIIARIKILSGLRTDEHQAAQDGRFRMKFEGGKFLDVRVSIVPTYFGENSVLRLLTVQDEGYTLETLGFSEQNQKIILKAIHKPYGMILATGPTGSGKTTTLYTIIKMLSKPEVAIVTIEDPIEYAVAGIEQIQVNPRTGLTFAQGLRSILRQDPNIIMVGEIRDSETAGIAINVALTGHLLLSTLHTNDPATTLPRLLDMGIESYLVASTVNIAIGQRLVRKICEKCKIKISFTALEIEALSESLPIDSVNLKETFYKGTGCNECSNTGYKGRLSIHEVLEINDSVREAILRKSSSSEIKQVAVKSGMVTMLEDGLYKVMAGLTTVEEILRITNE